ncbi:MAG: Na(+)-translocating NADH-quinone reductase subunit C [Gemmatimonas sp.]
MLALRRNSVGYAVAFAAVVCLVCAIPIAAAAVLLRPAQAENQRVDRLSKVLGVAGLLNADEKLTRSQILERFEANITARVVDMKSGEFVDSVDANTYNQRLASRDPERSDPATPNAARVIRLPRLGLIYENRAGGVLQSLILPIQGYGLWSTMYGYIALKDDVSTVAGITFYEHGETPGLGGEIENPRWQARWKDRKVYDNAGAVKVSVLKGAAGPAATDPYHVDGLSGATITSRGVTNTLQFWLGPDGFGPFLARYRGTSGGRT